MPTFDRGMFTAPVNGHANAEAARGAISWVSNDTLLFLVSGARIGEQRAKALTATRKEKGCITYDLNRDSKDAKRYVVYERWKSLADLAAHMKTDHIRTLLEALPDLTEGAPELRILLPAAE